MHIILTITLGSGYIEIMKYIVADKILRTRLVELGYKNISDLASKSHIHRNTLLKLLNGKDVFSNAFAKLSTVLRIDPIELLTPAPSLNQNIDYFEEIGGIISRLVEQDKDLAIFLLGSRARGTAKKYSDWDIAVFRYPAPLTGVEFLKLKSDVEDQGEDLVRMVDLVNLNQAPNWFLENLMNHKILFLNGSAESQAYFIGVLDGIRRRKAA